MFTTAWETNAQALIYFNQIIINTANNGMKELCDLYVFTLPDARIKIRANKIMM